MKRIKVLRNGIVKNQAEGQVAEMDAWLAQEIANGSFGKPERWVRAEDEDISGSLETRQVEKMPGEFVTEYRLAAEYTIVEEDLTTEIAAKQAKIDALRAQVVQMRDFDIDAATLAQLKPFLKLQRSIILKMNKILKDMLESAE